MRTHISRTFSGNLSGTGDLPDRVDSSMDVVRLCSELVRIRSENPPGDTEEIIQYIDGRLEQIGIRGKVLKSGNDRFNLVCHTPGSQILLCGHVDVVPAIPDGWTYPPFSGEIAEGAVHGRGTADMKGGCAAIIAACAAWAEKGESVPVDLAFVCDEETGGSGGIQYLIGKNAVKPMDCLIAEPTPRLHPNVGQKGLLRLTLDIEGVPGHGSLHPLFGRSAIMETNHLLNRCQEIHNRQYSAPGEVPELISRSASVLEKILEVPGAATVLRRVMFNPGVIHGGEKVNVIAQKCQIELEFRLPWGCQSHQIIEELTHGMPSVTIRKCETSEPSYTQPDHPLVQRVCRGIEQTCKNPASPILSWAASDARHLRRYGCAVAEYGPGDPTKIHVTNEEVMIEDLTRAFEVYSRLIGMYQSTS